MAEYWPLVWPNMDTILWPFRFFNVADFYRTYSSIIDFILYFWLFLGLSNAVFSERFKDRSGKLISTALGLLLSFAAISLESLSGFSLGNLSGFGMFILIGLLFYLLFNFLEKLGVSLPMAVSISYICSFLSLSILSSYIPADVLAILTILFLISLIVSIWGFIRFIGSGMTTDIFSLGEAGIRRIATAGVSLKAALSEQSKLLKEKESVIKKLEAVETQEISSNERIIQLIQLMSQALVNKDYEEFHSLYERFREIYAQRNEMIEITRTLRAAIQKQLKEALTLALQEKETAENKEIIEKKIVQPLLTQIKLYERDISKLEKQLSKTQGDIREGLKEFIVAINAKNIKGALNTLQTLRKFYEELDDLIKEITNLGMKSKRL